MVKKILTYIFDYVTEQNSESAKATALFVFVFCFCAECILNPQSAINTFMIHCIDIIAPSLPSTPASFTFGSLISNYSGALGTVLISDIIGTALSMFGLYLGVKLYKFLPFT
jgi:hypothetical protein